jgi:predicted deoxyguanosinetriphosphate triphosphohydrolase
MTNYKDILWLNEERVCNTSNNQKGEVDKIPMERSEIYKDLGKLIHLGQFRRLGGRTQVFSNHSNLLRSRLTHSLEVSNVGVQLSRMFFSALAEKNLSVSNNPIEKQISLGNKINDLVMFSCLAHDIGHPPFAHAGERALQSFSCDEISQENRENRGIRKFDSNIQNLRLLTKIHPYGIFNEISFTNASIDSVLKEKPYGPFQKEIKPLSAEEQKIIEVSIKTGTYLKKIDYVSQMNGWNASLKNDGKLKDSVSIDLNSEFMLIRHPVTYLMEVADDISYISADLEDALKHRYLTEKFVIGMLDDFKIKPYDQKDQKDQKFWKDIFDEARNKNNYEGVKSSLIKVMLDGINNQFKSIVEYYSIPKNFWELTKGSYDQEDKPTLIEFIINMPLILFDHAVKNWDKESEFGNLLYLKENPIYKNLYFKGSDLYKFKKKVLTKRLTSCREVVNGDSHAKLIVEKLVESLVPVLPATWNKKSIKKFKEDIIKIIGYFSEEYSNFIWDKIDEIDKIDKIDKDLEICSSDINNSIIDFIASMSDDYARQMYDELNMSILPKAS